MTWWEPVAIRAVGLLPFVLKPLGISPDPVVTLGAPFDHAADEDATFIHIPVNVERRKRWRGRTTRIQDCTVRLTLRCRGEVLERAGAWEDANAPHGFVAHRDLFYGYTTFNIPLMTQHSREIYWSRPGAGTFLADLNFMDERHPEETVISLRCDEFFVLVEVMAGDQTIASGEWLVSVRERSLVFETALTKLGSVADVASETFRFLPAKREAEPD